MKPEMIHQRILSISGDVECLSGVLCSMSSTSIQDAPDAYEKLSIDAAQRAEWIALRLRHLIYSTTAVKKWEYLLQAADTLGIEIRQTEGIYEIVLPGLMPKRKSRQGTEYLIDPLMAALEQYVRSHRVVRFPHTTVCFVLVYDWNLPERRIRDYDNLELKQILDAAAAYLMYSDTGLLCDTYHSTELGEKDRMRMFIMDTKRYPQWYAERQATLKSREKQG